MIDNIDNVDNLNNMIDIIEDVIIRIVNLPLCVKGVTVPSADNAYNIFINARYTLQAQTDTLKHELSHIKHCDFTNDELIYIIEERADRTSEK